MNYKILLFRDSLQVMIIPSKGLLEKQLMFDDSSLLYILENPSSVKRAQKKNFNNSNEAEIFYTLATN